MKIPTMPWVKYAGSPVLGGELGTCLDLSVLADGGKYRMYFSWRPKASLALTESVDGIHWRLRRSFWVRPPQAGKTT